MLLMKFPYVTEEFSLTLLKKFFYGAKEFFPFAKEFLYNQYFLIHNHNHYQNHTYA